MKTATLGVNVSLGGVNVSGQIQRQGEGQISADVALAAGKAGTLSTRTDDDTGVCTLATGHGITTGQKVSVVWDGGARINMDATVAGDDVTVDAGSGDNLPAQDTAVVVSVVQRINEVIVGDDIQILAAVCTKDAVLAFYDDGDSLLAVQNLYASEPFVYTSGGVLTNPLAGDTVAYVLVGNGEAAAALFNLGCLFDPTP